MDASTITELASRVADVVATDGAEAIDVKMAEMGDGSRRHFALVTTYSCGLEQEYRVTTPAPWNSPAWASVYKDWQVEVRVGDRWMILEGAEA